MIIIASTVTNTGLVTLDAGRDSFGNPIYRVAQWNGNRWFYRTYRSLETANLIYELTGRLI